MQLFERYYCFKSSQSFCVQVVKMVCLSYVCVSWGKHTTPAEGSTSVHVTVTCVILFAWCCDMNAFCETPRLRLCAHESLMCKHFNRNPCTLSQWCMYQERILDRMRVTWIARLTLVSVSMQQATVSLQQNWPSNLSYVFQTYPKVVTVPAQHSCMECPSILRSGLFLAKLLYGAHTVVGVHCPHQ
jgi:hypothetical protein